MFNPTVQLPSGGYIVIGITEALVAIDVNSGRATKEGSIEQTATKTNLEAADEVARQLRLRDLAGLIVIDFIDMDERRNNIAVEKRMKDKLKTDRARIQVGRISGFGLMEMSRQRLRPGMLEATTQMCSHCHGTGLLRSDDNVALAILRALEEEGVRGRSKEVLVRAPIAIANFLMNGKREHIGDIEARYGMSVRIECDPTLVSPDFAIEKFKTATRIVPEAAPIVASAIMFEDDDDDIVEETPDEEEADVVAEAPQAVTAETADGEERPKKKRRRRRRRRGGAGNGETQMDENGNPIEAAEAAEETAEAPAVEGEDAPAEKPKRTRTRSRKKVEETVEVVAEAAPVEAEVTAEPVAEEEKPKKRTRSRKKAEPKVEAEAEEAPAQDAAAAEEKPKPKRKSRAKPKAVVAEAEVAVVAETEAPAPVAEAPVVEAPVMVEPVVEVTPEPVQEATPEPAPAPAPEPAPKKPDAPKRKGWWSLGRS